MRRSIERTGWRVWLDENPSPDGWAAAEFDILMRYDAPIAVIQRIWHTDWRTASKRVQNWKKQHAQSS